jgi:hypothetical protein
MATCDYIVPVYRLHEHKHCLIFLIEVTPSRMEAGFKEVRRVYGSPPTHAYHELAVEE